MMRRGLAMGGALIFLVLIVLGVKGCLDARAHQALIDYARKVTQIVEETQQTSKTFFGKLSDPGRLSVTEFVAETAANRSAMDNYVTRVDSISAPDGMSHAQNALELVYELRGSAMTSVAEKISTALGNVGAGKASAAIANQMRKLLGGDVLYAATVRPEIDRILADNGIAGSDVPKSTFLPEGTKWLDPATISAALGGVSGSTASATPGVHGLGLVATSINGTELNAGAATTTSRKGTPEVEVKVQNQGESTENGVIVSVTVNGGHTLQHNISTIPAGETESVTIPLTPAPKGQVRLNVEIHPVPGERVLNNNKATYTVDFE